MFIHNLKHVSVFPCYSSSKLSCLPLACHCLVYPSRHPTAARVLAYQQHLNHISVFSLTLRLSCLPLASLHSRTLADTTLLHGCWLINIRDSVFSFISLYCRTNHYILVCSKFVFTKVFLLLTPGSCHPFFTFLYHFHLPDFLQPACFSACLLLFLCCLWPLP